MPPRKTWMPATTPGSSPGTGMTVERSLAAAIGSSPLDARIERGLHHIDGEVQRHEEQRQDQDGPLQQRQVALEDCCVEQEAAARQGEPGPDQDGAARKLAK